MAYTKQTWVNNETLVDEDRMNHIENGIYQNAEDISEINQSLSNFPEMQYGVSSILDTNAQSYSDWNITFSKPFSGTPRIFLSFRVNTTAMDYGNINVLCVTGTESTTGFTLRIINNGSQDRSPNVNWLAIYIPS